MGSLQPFDTSRMDHLMALGELTASQCIELRSLALASPAEHAPATTQEIVRHLQFIKATLPAQHTDDMTGKMRVTVFARILGEYSNAALAYMTNRVCRELDWFPTPKQCLAILADYRPPATRKEKALQICAQNSEVRFQAFLDAIKTGEISQATIDDASDHWKSIAYERGLLKRDGDTFTKRKG